jgi:hypothetical protein
VITGGAAGGAAASEAAAGAASSVGVWTVVGWTAGATVTFAVAYYLTRVFNENAAGIPDEWATNNMANNLLFLSGRADQTNVDKRRWWRTANPGNLPPSVLIAEGWTPVQDFEGFLAWLPPPRGSTQPLAPPILEIPTPAGPAVQDLSEEALAARLQVEQGAILYRMGTTGISGAAEAQFWALEHPSTPGFASRYGIPAENVEKFNFLEAGTLPPGTPFVTRRAPAVGENLGGGIEVVVPEGAVRLHTFSHLGGGG